jgi:hypothetical protein
MGNERRQRHSTKTREARSHDVCAYQGRGWGFGACEAKEGVEAALLELQKQVRLKILPTASRKV